MILIEIEGGDTPRFRLEFHPRLTVVAGLDAVQRRELSLAIRNVLTGQGRRMKLTVDIGGEPQTLDYDTVLALGLDHLEFDNIVNKQSLDQLAPLPTRLAPVRPEDAGADAATIAEHELQAALVRVRELEAQVAQLPAPPPSVETGILAAAEGEYTAARGRVEELRKQLEDMGASSEELSPGEQLSTLEALKASIEQKLDALRADLQDQPGDVGAIESALIAAAGGADVIREREELSGVLGQAGGAWTRVVNEINRLGRQPRPPEWLIVQTKDDLDEAQARIRAYTYQMEEGIDVAEPMARVRRQLAEAQEAWDEIEHGVEGQLAAAMDEREVLYQDVTRLLGREVPQDQVLDALAQRHEQLQTQPHPAQSLINALAQAGISATPENAVGSAEALIARRKELLDARPANQRALATAMVDLREVTQSLQQLTRRMEQPPVAPPDPADQKAKYDAAMAEAAAAEAHLKALQDAHALHAGYDPVAVADLRRRLDAAHGEAVAAQQKYEQIVPAVPAEQSDVEPAAPLDSDTVGTAAVRPWWEGGPRVAESLPPPADTATDPDIYLLSRAAGLRMLVQGESLPLIIDSVLEGLSQEAVVRTLQSLSKISAIVQIIYLGGEDGAEKWAKRQDIYTGAVVRLERA